MLVGEFPAYESQESIRTLEVPILAAESTEEVLLDDILELTPIAAVVSSAVAPPTATARRAPLRTTVAHAHDRAPRSMGPWIAGGVAIGVLVSLGVAVVVRVVDARTPYPRTHVTVVQATGRAAAPPPPARPAPAAAAAAPSPLPAAASTASTAGVPSIRLDTLPIVPATRGTLRFSAKAHGHRVFVDGVVLGESDGAIDVHCGKHSIQVGSHGEAENVDVPCGGDVLVK